MVNPKARRLGKEEREEEEERKRRRRSFRRA